MKELKNDSLYLSDFSSISEIEILKNLSNTISELKISKYNKEKIQKVIDFEIILIENDLIKNLGKLEYEKMKKSKGVE